MNILLNGNGSSQHHLVIVMLLMLIKAKKNRLEPVFGHLRCSFASSLI
jgi:hypothetical protein